MHRRGLRAVVALALVLATISATHATAQEEDALTDDELRQLEQALGADAAARKPDAPTASSPVARAVQSMNPDIAVVLDVALAWFSDTPRQLGAHDPNQNGFTLQQLELSLGAVVDPWFRVDVNLVFALFGVELEEAVVTSLALPASLQLRVGQFLTRFGRLNASHPHRWAFADQPLVLGKFFGPEGSRGLGLELSWLAPLPWFVELVATATNADGSCCARSFLGGTQRSIESPADFLYTLALKQFFDLGRDWGLSWGLSVQLGPNPTGHDNRTEIYGTDLYLKYRPVDSTDRTELTLQLEALLRSRQVPGDALQDLGGYAQLVWRIDPEWETGLRAELVSGVLGGALDPLDPDWSDTRGRYVAQGTWYPSHFSRLRLQAGLDHPRLDQSPSWLAMLAFEIVAGAHGAHAY